MIIKLIILIILILLSGLFSGTETAYVSLGKFKYKEYLKKKKYNYKLVEKLKHKPHVLLSTVLIGNNIVNIGAASVATLLGAEIFSYLGLTISEAWSAGIVTGVLTLIVLIFGEVIPKNYAAKNYEKIVGKSARYLYILSIIFRPLIVLLDFINKSIVKSEYSDDKVTEEEIKTIVTVGSDEGGIESYEKTLIHRIFLFDDILSKEVITPRQKVILIEYNETIKTAYEKIIDEPYSRYPIFKENFDNIIGYIHLKDIFKEYNKGNKDKPITEIMKKILYIPETKPIDELFKEMQKKKIHIAAIVDEFGGFSGIITLEDLVEEVFGEIYDEHDDRIKEVQQIGKKKYLISGETTIREIKEHLPLKIDSDFDAETISSFVLSKLGRIPNKGEVIIIKHGQIVINKIIKNKIDSIILKF